MSVLLCSSQRIALTLVQSAYACAVESLLIDFEEGAEKKLGRQLLDGEANGISGAGKSPVSKTRTSGFPASCGEKLGFHAVIECSH
jgi:hypothetical protein